MVKTSNKQDRLDQIASEIIDDKVCSDLAMTATQLVFGDGNANAEIVFIGEAPGKNEDEQGKPFVGAAGKFLSEMLEMIGLERSDVYITNIVKYRPPNNRDPYPDEKAEFLSYLQRQLEVIKPVLVITLGRHSLNCFLPDLSISQVHGQPKRIRLKNHEVERTERNDSSGQETGKRPFTSLVILPLFHPAAALYNGAMRQTLIDDFAKIPHIMKSIKEAK